MLQWLIIGGGVHGTYLSHLLTGTLGVRYDDLRVLDPHDMPLAVWTRNAANSGMRHLRSPSTHNLDTQILSLYRFAKADRQTDVRVDFIPPYNRPSLALFQRHWQLVVKENRLDHLRIRGRAVDVRKTGRNLTVLTDSDAISARRIILAIGLGEQPCWPAWAQQLKSCRGAIDHIFDPDFGLESVSKVERVLVVGAGITGVQAALRLADAFGRKVTVIAARPIVANNLDFDPCWIGPKCMRRFEGADEGQRRRMIDAARYSGTVPQETAAALKAAVSEGRIGFRVARIESGSVAAGEVRLHTPEGDVAGDHVLLTTGFDPKRPGGALVDGMIRRFGLKTAACGYPLVDRHLRWHPRIFVSGPLSELEIGPCARNIVGARNAGRHLAAFLTRSKDLSR